MFNIINLILSTNHQNGSRMRTFDPYSPYDLGQELSTQYLLSPMIMVTYSLFQCLWPELARTLQYTISHRHGSPPT
jgi:hypothetical protein